MSLDLVVAQQQYRMGVLSRALHEASGWGFEVGGLRVPASREVLEDRVRFQAVLPDLPFREASDTVALLHDGELVMISERPHETGRRIFWDIKLESPVGV